jgi:excisionase family DNA binding protein
MTWTYDVTRDVLTVTYGLTNGAAHKSVRAGGCVVSLDRGGNVVKIELLRASQRYSLDVLTALDDGARQGITAVEAAATLGVKLYAVRDEILSGGMPAFKVGQTWRIANPILDIYREILAARRSRQ